MWPEQKTTERFSGKLENCSVVTPAETALDNDPAHSELSVNPSRPDRKCARALSKDVASQHRHTAITVAGELGFESGRNFAGHAAGAGEKVENTVLAEKGEMFLKDPN